MKFKRESVRLPAKDLYPLAANFFKAEGEEKAVIIVAGATGVPQNFYFPFASYAASKGFSVLTFDYRGLAGSKPETLKGFKADMLDWARLDLEAALDLMAEKGKPLFLLGHSYGGHALGLLSNHKLLTASALTATGAGWHGWMPLGESLKVRFLWNFLLPILSSLKSYAPFSLLGMGEDLPLNVYKQWRYWCKFPHYFFDDPKMAYLKELYAEVKLPILAISALDDLWALPASRDAFMKAYSGADVFNYDLDPAEEGFGPVSHMGYFRERAKPLWDYILKWFEDQGL